MKHGACLALGIAGMGTARTDLYAALKAALELDDAVIGEAAATPAGLIMLGVHPYTKFYSQGTAFPLSH